MSAHVAPRPTSSLLSSRVEPCAFDGAGGRLCGCTHVPGGEVRRGCGIVICPPIGHESIRCHRAGRALAAELARRGFPVLRFDYSGCGDSAGDGLAARLDVWRDDTLAAGEHLRARASVGRLALIGLRLGATLATLAATRHRGIDRLVLWQPVTEGPVHLQELREAHRSYEADVGIASGPLHPDDPDHPARPGGGFEVLGFPYGEGLAEDLAGLDLAAALQAPPAREALLIDSAECRTDERFSQCLEAMIPRVDHELSSDPEIWLAEPYRMLMPRHSIARIVQWFERSQP